MLLAGETLQQRRVRLQTAERAAFLQTKRATKQRATRRAFLKTKEATAARAKRKAAEHEAAERATRLRVIPMGLEFAGGRRNNPFLSTQFAAGGGLPMGGRPGDSRPFVHKKILGGIAKIAGVVPIPGANIISTAARFLSRGQTSNAADFKFGGNGFDVGLSLVDRGPCDDPALIRAPDGHCVAVGSGHHRKHFGGVVGGPAGPVGDPVMGRYGAGETPGSKLIDRAVCRRGMQLGDDGICYNKAQITNKQRMWPAGRKPLLTGGDMRAISIAARAGKRMDGATTRLRRLGMMKKAPVSRLPKTPPVHQRLLEAHVTK